MKSKEVFTFIAMCLLLGLTSACLGRASFQEATEELKSLVDPAVRAGFAAVDEMPQPLTSPQECSDPILGPSEGLRPTISYEIPLSQLNMTPEAFISTVESVWREEGADLEVDDKDHLLSRYASRDTYRARAIVNMENDNVYVGGSGPCVDGPNR